MTPEVEAAVEELRQTFPGHRLDVEPEGQGGAYVAVHDLPLGDRYVPPASWVGFLVTFQYPRADVYPHFLGGDVRRADGRPHGPAFSGPIAWRGRPAVQVSRRSNRWDPARDTAAVKLLKVLEWVRSQ